MLRCMPSTGYRGDRCRHDRPEVYWYQITPFRRRRRNETDPIYFDEAAAQGAGHSSILMPPTFLFCLEMEHPDPYLWFRELGIPLPRALHGGQRFQYYRPAYAGEVMTFRSEIVDIYAKKNGALEFVVQDVFITNQRAESVADFRRTIAIRNG